ncbi:MAG: hypothetical protein ABI304_08875 [Rudaea sp.]
MFKQSAFLSCTFTVASVLACGMFCTPLFAAGSWQLHTGQAKPSSATGGTRPAENFVASYRAYPPSCLVDGLPFGQASLDPNAKTVPLTFYSYSTTVGGGVGGFVSEAGSVSVWRVPCSGGVAATLIELDRLNGNDGSTTQYPEFPEIYITPTDISTPFINPRIAREPNTLFENVAAGGYFYSSSVYVLDYFDPTNPANPSNGATRSTIDYDQAFSLQINNLAGGSNLIIDVPAYVAASNELMPISGYMSTNWSNPNQSGEGMVVQVYDAGDQTNRILAFAWFTYDSVGAPFWLYGQVTFPIGTTSVSVPTAYFQNGSFAPMSPSSNVQNTSWGTVAISFPDCGHMSIHYDGDASAVQGPSGSGDETFQRVANVDNLTCQ